MDKTNQINNNGNALPNINSPATFYPMIITIIIFVIALFIIMFKINVTGNTAKSQEQIVADIFTILFFLLIVFILSIILLPNFKDIKKLLSQISNVSYVVVYTIGLILFFTLASTDTINTYAKFIIPVTVAIGAFLFFKAFKTNYIEDFNLNYEKIKTVILLFCFIATVIIFYSSDPGGYISKYFGFTMLLTILLSLFAFLYLIITLTLQNDTSGININSINSINKFTMYGSILFLIFLLTIGIIILTYPGGFFTDKATSSSSMILILIISILWVLLLSSSMQQSNNSSKTSANDTINLFKKSLLFLSGFCISGLLIYWIVYNIQSLSGQSSIVSLILNLLLAITVLALIYKTMNAQLPSGNSNKNGFFNLIINIIFYIPCLFANIFDGFLKEYKNTNLSSIIMLFVSILLLVLYFIIPKLLTTINLQGGKQLINNPVYTDTQYSLGTYETLNGSDKFDYEYAISFWLFLDAAPPNTNESYEKYTSILNFGNKPNVLYNGKTHTLMITMEQKDLQKTTDNKLTDFDENGNRILYKNHNILLQKWNNFIINYSGGVLDIFLNGELVKSDIGVVPYYTLDNLTTGENNGIKGGICNVVYFRNALTSPKIHYLYNSLKNKTPPVLNESNKDITE